MEDEPIQTIDLSGTLREEGIETPQPSRVRVSSTSADDIVIKEQPKSVEVSYPDGATFHVEVEKPEDVASYQWTYSDGSNTFVLDGTSASTDTRGLPTAGSTGHVFQAETAMNPSTDRSFTSERIPKHTSKRENAGNWSSTR